MGFASWILTGSLDATSHDLLSRRDRRGASLNHATGLRDAMPARPPVQGGFWKDRTVLVTGGTGSFGRKFAHIVLQEPVRKLIVFSRDELKQHQMRTNGFDDPPIRYFIGDGRVVDRLRRAMQ